MRELFIYIVTKKLVDINLHVTNVDTLSRTIDNVFISIYLIKLQA